MGYLDEPRVPAARITDRRVSPSPFQFRMRHLGLDPDPDPEATQDFFAGQGFISGDWFGSKAGAAAVADETFLTEQAENIILENVFEYQRPTQLQLDEGITLPTPGRIGALRADETEFELARQAVGISAERARTREGLFEVMRRTRELGGTLPPTLQRASDAARNFIQQQQDRYQEADVGLGHDLLAWIGENPEEATAEVIIGGAATLIPGVGALPLLARGGFGAAIGRGALAEAAIGAVVPATVGAARHLKSEEIYDAAGLEYNARANYFTEIAVASGLGALIGGAVRAIETPLAGGARILNDDEKAIAEGLLLRRYFGRTRQEHESTRKEFEELLKGDTKLHGTLIKDIENFELDGQVGA